MLDVVCLSTLLVSSAECQPKVVYDLVVDLLFLLVELWLAPACPTPPGAATDSDPSPPE
jgi:hypothetical protein